MNRFRVLGGAALFTVLSVLGRSEVRAHCDGMDGPVVKAAQDALAKGDVNRVLAWVRKADEAEIREAFEKTLAFRAIGAEARQFADTCFFETLVRIHRAGEGAPYAGLKPAGRDLGPAIPAADRALESGSEEELLKLISTAVETGLREKFRAAKSRRPHDPRDVSAGRDYVKAYVEYVHHVERLYEAAKGPVHGHFPEGGPGAAGDHDHR